MSTFEPGPVSAVDAVLRPWRSSDAAALVAASAEDPDLGRQWGAPGSIGVDDALAIIDQRLASTPRSQNWAIADAADGRALGNVGIAAIDHEHATGWMHYWVAPAARGAGLASAALAAASTWGFAAGLFRLELGHRVNNPASCAVALRCGYLAEGIERQKLTYGGRRFDVETHALLETDPQALVTPLAFE